MYSSACKLSLVGLEEDTAHGTPGRNGPDVVLQLSIHDYSSVLNQLSW